MSELTTEKLREQLSGQSGLDDQRSERLEAAFKSSFETSFNSFAVEIRGWAKRIEQQEKLGNSDGNRDGNSDWRTLVLFVTLLGAMGTMGIWAIEKNADDIRFDKEHASANVKVLQEGFRLQALQLKTVEETLHRDLGSLEVKTMAAVTATEAHSDERDTRQGKEIDLKIEPLRVDIKNLHEQIGVVPIMERIRHIDTPHGNLD